MALLTNFGREDHRYVHVTNLNVRIYACFVFFENIFQISTNGYISIDLPQHISSVSIPGSETYSIVAPYAADLDTTYEGTVIYSDFSSDDPSMISVSSFIRNETGNDFYGTQMMVVEWNGVPLFSGNSVSIIIIIFK